MFQFGFSLQPFTATIRTRGTHRSSLPRGILITVYKHFDKISEDTFIQINTVLITFSAYFVQLVITELGQSNDFFYLDAVVAQLMMNAASPSQGPPFKTRRRCPREGSQRPACIMLVSLGRHGSKRRA